MTKMPQGQGRGWHGESDRHAKAGSLGGKTTANRYGPEFYGEIGKKGGVKSKGKFISGSTRAREAGRKGGEARARKRPE